MQMTPRENYEAFLNHEPVEWIPVYAKDFTSVGGRRELWENGPLEGGLDAFGCNWIPTGSASGQPALDPTVVPLDDVCDWEDKVIFPDLDAIDWEAFAEQELARADRENMVIEYHTWNSVFLRLGHLLGFEEALCAFFEEPEATKALCMAIADYKIALLEHAAHEHTAAEVVYERADRNKPFVGMTKDHAFHTHFRGGIIVVTRRAQAHLRGPAVRRPTCPS